MLQLNISQNQISRVNPDTLARAVNNMEQVMTSHGRIGNTKS